MQQKNLPWKTVIISGATRGIGARTAQRYSRAGWRVVCLGRDKKQLAETLADLPGQGHVLWSGDLTDNASAKKLSSFLNKNLLEGAQQLICNAGINHIGSLVETDIEKARLVMDTNYIANLILVKSTLPLLHRSVKCGYDTRILFVSSIVGVLGVPRRGVYSASKWALEALAATLRVEMIDFGIKVQIIRPAGVSTDFHHNTPTDAKTPKSSISVRSPEQIADKIFKLTHLKQYSMAPGFLNAGIQWLGRHFPGSLVSGMYKKFRKEAMGIELAGKKE
ncbi:MAG: SDR family NAD(P)-dependent oxidoreductase [Leptospiraceae bacterium]|nr:SDR family NAD(P)-dependent oxidoreductase [Leptospiraceae bacterium]